jgi:N-acetylglucosaminyl-diphospho-decaprenol L-rhamnosyltransferase
VTLSIVIAAHNFAAVIGQCLASITRLCGDDVDIVVVDNASRDDSREVVRAAAPSGRVLALFQNAGFGRGCNVGAAQTASEWLLFMNPDVRLTRLELPSSISASFGIGGWVAQDS